MSELSKPWVRVVPVPVALSTIWLPLQESTDLLDVVPPAALERPARRFNGSTFTLRTLVQYYLHDVVHHLHDVGADQE